VDLLCDLVEGNLLAAQQEIDKLVMLDPGAQVDTEMIRQSTANNARFGAFQLGESLLGGKAGDCLKISAGLQRTGMAIQEVTGALSYQLAQLNALYCAVRSGESEKAALDRLRIFKMAQPLFRQALSRLSGRQIGNSFRALALLDRQGKGRARGDPWHTLNRMLLELCCGETRP
ncbi:MAG: DNA polymerase III subunit delta, partial [Lysobacterales bacterium]